MNDEAMFEKAAGDRLDTDVCRFVRSYTAGMLKSGWLETEDLAPIIYIKFIIYGMDEKFRSGM